MTQIKTPGGYTLSGNYWVAGSTPGIFKGLKLHVSANPTCAQNVADAVLPYLVELKVLNKVVCDSSRLGTEGQGAKFITVYPSSCRQTVDIATKLNSLLNNLQDPPQIGGGDLQIGATGWVWIRYGEFTTDMEKDDARTTPSQVLMEWIKTQAVDEKTNKRIFLSDGRADFDLDTSTFEPYDEKKTPPGPGPSSSGPTKKLTIKCCCAIQ